MYKIGLDPGTRNSAIAIFQEANLLLAGKLPELIDLNEDLDEWYRSLLIFTCMVETPCTWVTERFTSRGSASKIAEIMNIQAGMAVALCKTRGFTYRLVTAQSWKRRLNPEYPKGSDHHLIDAQYLALLT